MLATSGQPPEEETFEGPVFATSWLVSLSLIS